MSTSESSPESVNELADSGQFEHKQRLKEIFERVNEADAKYKAAEDPEYETTEFDCYTAVKSLAAAIEPLANRHVHKQDDPNEGLVDYWLERDLGAVELHPPQVLLDIIQEPSIRVVGNPDLSPVEISIIGLGNSNNDDQVYEFAFLESPRYFSFTWSVTVRPRHTEKKTITRGVEKVMPIEISFGAYRCCRLFLEELGIELSVQEQSGDAGFDYEDILQDGPPEGA